MNKSDKDTNFVQAVGNTIHKQFKNPNMTKFKMYVDDSLFIQTRNDTKHIMAASSEALYSIIELFPKTERR